MWKFNLGTELRLLVLVASTFICCPLGLTFEILKENIVQIPMTLFSGDEILSMWLVSLFWKGISVGKQTGEIGCLYGSYRQGPFLYKLYMCK